MPTLLVNNQLKENWITLFTPICFHAHLPAPQYGLRDARMIVSWHKRWILKAMPAYLNPLASSSVYIEGYLREENCFIGKRELRNRPAIWITALKVISFATLIMPLVAFALLLYARFNFQYMEKSVAERSFRVFENWVFRFRARKSRDQHALQMASYSALISRITSGKQKGGQVSLEQTLSLPEAIDSHSPIPTPPASARIASPSPQTAVTVISADETVFNFLETPPQLSELPTQRILKKEAWVAFKQLKDDPLCRIIQIKQFRSLQERELLASAKITLSTDNKTLTVKEFYINSSHSWMQSFPNQPAAEQILARQILGASTRYLSCASPNICEQKLVIEGDLANLLTLDGPDRTVEDRFITKRQIDTDPFSSASALEVPLLASALLETPSLQPHFLRQAKTLLLGAREQMYLPKHPRDSMVSTSAHKR